MSQLSLNSADLQFLESHSQKVKLPAQQFIFHEGDDCSKFLLVISGSVRVQKVSENGRMVTLYRVGDNGMCILTTSCLLGNQKYNAEGVTETPTEAFILSDANFRELMHKSSSFRESVFQSMSLRMSSLILKIDDIAFGQINHRIAKALLKFAHNGIVEKTHQEIADEIGSAREVVSRHLKEFERKGLLISQRQTLKLNLPQFTDAYPIENT